ncbi:unnamed protein product [Allacma fusca]|uniref:Uncharacterized protein n=1 Tax=Allacma fusca TaxID=39272 RepID=A0A8J2LWX8_9HEXA|nr:unnamed protein product [Allacma fusca]
MEGREGKKNWENSVRKQCSSLHEIWGAGWEKAQEDQVVLWSVSMCRLMRNQCEELVEDAGDEKSLAGNPCRSSVGLAGQVGPEAEFGSVPSGVHQCSLWLVGTESWWLVAGSLQYPVKLT